MNFESTIYFILEANLGKQWLPLDKELNNKAFNEPHLYNLRIWLIERIASIFLFEKHSNILDNFQVVDASKPHFALRRSTLNSIWIDLGKFVVIT